MNTHSLKMRCINIFVMSSVLRQLRKTSVTISVESWVSGRIFNIWPLRKDHLLQVNLHVFNPSIFHISPFLHDTLVITRCCQILIGQRQNCGTWNCVFILRTFLENVQITTLVCRSEKGTLWAPVPTQFQPEIAGLHRWVKQQGLKACNAVRTIKSRQFHLTPDIYYKKICVTYPNHNFQRYCVRRYSSSKGHTVEKLLLALMGMWEMKEAMLVLKQAVMKGKVPDPTVILNLQQQLANLGEVECLLELHDLLKEQKLTRDTKFFQHLQEAYYNSGRIAEGVEVLYMMYHRTCKFSDVEVFFCLLTIMILRHFPDRTDSIISFVKDLKDAEGTVVEAEAALWKCYLLTEHWEEADSLMFDNENLKRLIPAQVSHICHGVDNVQFDAAVVLGHLLSQSFIKQKLRALVAKTLILELSSRNEWYQLLKVLDHMKSMQIPIHSNNLAVAIKELEQYLSPQCDEQLQALKHWCQNLLPGQEKN